MNTRTLTTKAIGIVVAPSALDLGASIGKAAVNRGWNPQFHYILCLMPN